MAARRRMVGVAKETLAAALDPSTTTVGDLEKLSTRMVRTNSEEIRKRMESEDLVSPASSEEPEEELQDATLEHLTQAYSQITAETPAKSVVYGQSEVPAPEDPPARRDAPTVHVETSLPQELPVAPDLVGVQPRRLDQFDDLFAHYPFDGTGLYYATVIRRQPKNWGSWRCDGEQLRISQPMTIEQFAAVYGGGEYVLRVYGPPPRGGIYDPQWGRVRPKALSNDITVTIPYDRSSSAGVPPNPNAAISDLIPDEEDSPMQTVPNLPTPSRSRVTSDADARIAISSNETQLKREDFERQDRKDQERAQLEVLKEQELTRRSQIERETSMTERALSVVEQRLADSQKRERELTEKLLELQRENASDRSGAEQIANVITAANRDEVRALSMQLERLSETHKNEMRQLVEAHARELQRVSEMSTSKVEAMQERLEEKGRDLNTAIERERAAADRQVREANERAERRISEAEERAKRDIETLQRTCDSRLVDLERNWSARLDEERRVHDREINSLRTVQEIAKQSEVTVFGVQKSSLDAELARLAAENDRLRTELGKKADLVTQMNEMRQLATSLGFQPPGASSSEEEEDEEPSAEPQTVGQQLVSAGISALQQLPAMVSAAAGAVAARRAPQAPTPPAGHMALQPPQNFQPRRRLAFASEDGLTAPLGEMNQLAPMPQQPMPPPVAPAPASIPAAPALIQDFAIPPAMPAPVAPVAFQPQDFAQPPLPAPMTSILPPPPPESFAALPSSPLPASAEATAQEAAEDQQILNFREPVEQAFRAKMSPQDFLNGMIQSMGGNREMVKMIASSLSADRIVLALARTGTKSPLRKSAGRNWLKQLEEAAAAL